MSFSTEVKKELYDVFTSNKCCHLAELLGIYSVCGVKSDKNDKANVKFQTENIFLANKIYTLIKLISKTTIQIKIKNRMHPSKNRVFEIQSNCCKRSYIRGAFISCGSITNPSKTYHIEFLNHIEKSSIVLMSLIDYFDLHSKIVKRKNVYVVYMKEGESIVDLLNIMGAHLSLMDFENIRIIKEVRNSVNRKVNCETANLSKTINASLNQIEDINYIKSIKGLSFLTERLQNVAIIRLKYPDESLKEIGEKLTPQVGKSGVNHRLRKISEIANILRGGIL
jgi:cell division protein WhiA